MRYNKCMTLIGFARETYFNSSNLSCEVARGVARDRENWEIADIRAHGNERPFSALHADGATNAALCMTVSNGIRPELCQVHGA